MALLDEKNLAAEAAKRARFRVHHVGTKLNEAELHELEALARKRSQTQAELIRGLIRSEIEQDKMSLRGSAEMVEITACRLLLTHLLRPMAPLRHVCREHSLWLSQRSDRPKDSLELTLKRMPLAFGAVLSPTQFSPIGHGICWQNSPL
jgi:hypothetical protein